MKTKKELVTARLRIYSITSTKKSDQRQILLEIRNYTPQIIRIALRNSDFSTVNILSNQMVKGQVVSRKDAHHINARIAKIRLRINYVMQFLKYANYPINSKQIEQFVYVKWQDVYSYFSEIVDAEDEQAFFTHLEKSDKLKKEEALAHNQLLATIGSYRATGILEALSLHKFENSQPNFIVKSFTNYCKSLNISDYPISQFDANVMNQYINYVIQTPITPNGNKFYAVKSITSLIKQIKIWTKEMRKIGYEINPEILNYQMVKGNRSNANIKFVNDEKANVYSITKNELEQIKAAIGNKKLPLRQRNAATLFMLQTLLGGLRISELSSIHKDNFKLINGRYYLYLTTQKTAKMIDSPLHSELLPILESINFDIQKLLFSKQIYNRELKNLAKSLNLNRQIVQLTTAANQSQQHVVIQPLYEVISNKQARKAAVTLLFAAGYGLEQISKITKHSLSAIQYYVAILNDDKTVMIQNL